MRQRCPVSPTPDSLRHAQHTYSFRQRLAIKVTLMHLYVVSNNSCDPPPSGCYGQMTLAPHAVWCHYDIEDMQCQGAPASGANGWDGTLYAAQTRQTSSMEAARWPRAGRLLTSTEEQAGEG